VVYIERGVAGVDPESRSTRERCRSRTQTTGVEREALASGSPAAGATSWVEIVRPIGDELADEYGLERAWWTRAQRAGRATAPADPADRLIGVDGMTVAGNRRGAAVGGEGSFLNCPRCGLSIRQRARSLRIDHCPRCLARSRAMVELFASTLPSDELYGAGLAPNGTIARPARGDQRVSRDH
jgi:hypothetical protein